MIDARQALRNPLVKATVALLAALAPMSGFCASPSQAVPSLPPIEVKDLAYGDVLFHYFQDDYFASLIRLLAARDRGSIPHHADDGELLLGGLYLSLGQHREAGDIFAQVLERPGVPVPVRERARFYLGKVWYQRGYFDKASEVLGRAGSGSLPEGMEAERRLLLAESLLAQQRYDDAVASLANWNAPPGWAGYAAFNRGVALIRSGRQDEGLRELDNLGRRAGRTAEGAALADKANLALGYTLLQAGHPAEAQEALSRIRLEGPLTTRALLGAGWASSTAGHYEEALTPWLELRSRNILDSAVQESYLAVPYAYAKLGATAQAAEYYESAVSEFEAESRRLDEEIVAIRDGRLLSSVIGSQLTGDISWSWQLKKIPDAPASRYLYHLMAQNDFQEALKNYRQLLFLQHTLEGWAGSLEAFENMVQTRQARDSEELPKAKERLSKVDMDALRARRTSIEATLVSAESRGDVVALGTSHERETYAKVGVLEAAAADSSDEDAEEARDKLRLMKGVLYWQMHSAYKARVWAVRKDDREVAQAMRESETRLAQVNAALTSVSDRDAMFASRVAQLGPRIGSARDRIERLRAAEEAYLADLAVQELTAQKQRLSEYLLQARYALATLYDRAADEATRAQPPAAQAPAKPQ